jgi:hypothetical protein
MQTEEQQQGQPASPVQPAGVHTCEDCGKSYKSRGSLMGHRRIQHGIRTRGGYSRTRKTEQAQPRQTDESAVREKKPHVQVHFCPKCGTNIDAVNMAIKMTS